MSVLALGVVPESGDRLTIVELPEHHPTPGTVRIAVYAAAISPTDIAVRKGINPERHDGAPPPYVPGMDVAGVIDEVGPGVDDLRVGDKVMAIVVPRGSHGGYSESLVLPAASVTKVPVGTTLVEASTLPMNGLTAFRALDLLALPTGGTLAVSGAAGVLGRYTTQVATVNGLCVVADATDRDRELVRSAGAAVVVRRGTGFATGILDMFAGGVDGCVDTAVIGEALLKAVRSGGAFAAVRRFDGQTERGIMIHNVRVRDYANQTGKLARLRELVETGSLKLNVAGVVAPADVDQAHAQLEAGGVRGRLVIEFRREENE